MVYRSRFGSVLDGRILPRFQLAMATVVPSDIVMNSMDVLVQSHREAMERLEEEIPLYDTEEIFAMPFEANLLGLKREMLVRWLDENPQKEGAFRVKKGRLEGMEKVLFFVPSLGGDVEQVSGQVLEGYDEGARLLQVTGLEPHSLPFLLEALSMLEISLPLLLRSRFRDWDPLPFSLLSSLFDHITVRGVIEEWDPLEVPWQGMEEAQALASEGDSVSYEIGQGGRGHEGVESLLKAWSEEKGVPVVVG